MLGKDRQRPPRLLRIRAILVLVLLIVIGFGIYHLFIQDRQSLQARVEDSVTLKIRPDAALICEPGPFQSEADWQNCLKTDRETLNSGETLGHVLDRLGLGGREAHLVTEAAGEIMDLTKIRPGARITLYRNAVNGDPVKLEYVRGENRPKLIMIRTPAGYAATWQRFEPIRSLSAAAGIIRRSLWGTAVQIYKLDPELVLGMADVFASDLDFFTDVQAGDEFRILYIKKYSQGKALGSGRILAAEFVNKGTAYRAYFFENAKGETGYFDEQGHSKKKMFLKSPLQYRRISSFFSNSRLHPILKIRRPHHGVDYAAARGTPVETVASGTVDFVGRKGGYGNLVVIKHGKTYETMYAHLSKFAAGLKKGRKVQQGDLIGYVGSTGLATGPHLDFRMKRSGTFVDPLVELDRQSAIPLEASDKSRFKEMVGQRDSEWAELLADLPEETNTEEASID